MLRSLGLMAFVGLLGIVVAGSTCPGPPAHFLLPGLTGTVRVSIDEFGVPHVEAQNDHDAFMVQGYLHARDRFFEMDWNRRAADGRKAQFSGNPNDLTADANTRVLGLRAAAQRSLDALPADDLAVLQAYADGVNAWLAFHPLPPEYATLEVSVVAPWTPLDTLLLIKGMFANTVGPRIWEIDETARFESYVAALGEDRARLLYPNELGRFAPWVPNATVPDALGTTVAARRRGALQRTALGRSGELAQEVRSRADSGGFLAQVLERRDPSRGSNAWGVAASHSETGGPLVAGDPHLGLLAPAIGYEIHLVVAVDPQSGPLNVSGASVPGLPGVVLGGQTAQLAWAVTAFAPDVSDVFRDRLIRGDPNCSARLCILSAGAAHPVEERSETYFLNARGDGVANNTTDATAFVNFLAPQAVQVLTVPFRSFGPVLNVADRSVLTETGPAETDILTLQWTGLHADRAPRYALAAMRARDVFEFGDAVQWLTIAGFNHVVADVDGNLAYYAGGEIPLRTDLEAGTPLDGMPPLLIRDGSGPANWVPDPARSQGQMLPFAVLPREEMPHVVNPPAGFVVNCNEDPSGFVLDNDLIDQFRPSNPQAIHYLGEIGTRGLRNGRVTNLLREKILAGQTISLDDMKRIQVDTQALHVNVLLPHLLAAFESARREGAPDLLAAFAADPRMVEAIGRLGTWDASHPTGIPEGYDASDVDGVRASVVSDAEARASVAATIYEAWSMKLVKAFRATVQAQGLQNIAPLYTLVWLVSQDPFTGVGASGVNYFPEPAALTEAADRRDAVLLGVLRDVLDALPGPTYALAFANSTNQDDYRWGKLHRTVLAHPLGGSASIPPAAGITDLAPQLPGFARDGTWESVNLAGFPGNPDGANEWVNSGGQGPFFRHVHAPLARTDSGAGMLGFAVLAGGSSGDPQSPDYASQLGLWLTGDYHAVPMTVADARAAARRTELFDPPSP